jgi:hypothetical protein
MVIYFAYNLSPRFSLGLKFTGGSDFRELNFLEGDLFFRWYYLKQSSLPNTESSTPLPRRAFFLQGGAGGGLYGAFLEHLQFHPSVLGEAAAGLRLYLLHGGAPMFLEPYIRYAYPSGFGIGFIVGG